MTCTWRYVAALLASGLGMDLISARAAPVFTQAGDATFHNITATGGALTGVDVSSALVRMGGSSANLSSVALQAMSAVPMSMAGQPNGWLKLDPTGLVPAIALPAAVMNPVDAVARSAAAAAAAAASAAIPSSLLGKPNGAAILDGNALVPVSSLPVSVTNPVDMAARGTAAAALATAAAAMPSSQANKPGGFAQLDASALIPSTVLPASVTNPVDGTARAAAGAAQSAANSAQALAAAAAPASLAGRTGGWAPLDQNALVPAANLPAAYTSASALATSTLGQANGPARLDAVGSLSNNMAAATANAVQRSLASHFADTVNAADYGMKCDYQTLGDLTTTRGSVVVSSTSYAFGQNDVGRKFVGGYELGLTNTTIASVNANGTANLASAATATMQPVAASGSTPASPAHGYANLWTDDTNALQAAVAVATSRLGGADLIIPGGQCELSAEIDAADATSLRIRGSGVQATRLDWTTATNGLIVTETNGASLTIGDFMISKHPGTNGSTTFLDTALSIGGASGQTGENKIGDISIIGASPAGQTDGWNQGLVETNLTHAFTSHISVLQPGATIPQSGVPAPNNPIAMPAAYGFGVGADIVLQGTNGGYYVDGALDGLTTTGGNVSLDMASFQGAYITNSKLTYANFGLRGDTPGTTSELVNLSNSYVIANIADLYLNGVGNNQITGNLFWPSSPNVASWVGVWLRNTDSDEVTGNGFLGHVGQNSVADFGSYISWDNGGGYAHTVTGNTFYQIHGTAMSNAPNTGAIVAVGNTIIASTIATSDPAYGATNGTGNGAAVTTSGMGNMYFANILNGLTAMSDDGNRNIQFAKNLTCGNAFDSCTLKVIGTGNSTSFTVDPSGNAVAAASVRTPNVTTGSAAGHRTVATDLGLSSATGTFTTDGNAPAAGNSLASLPSPSQSGAIEVQGEASCVDPASDAESFQFSALWVASGSGALSLKSFTAPEFDGQTAAPKGWAMQAAVDATGTHPLIEMTGLPASTDCSAHVSETFVQ